jgi:RNA-binding protein
MLNSKQRSYLKKLAHDFQPLFQIGKGGIGENSVISINELLEARELIKISVLSNMDMDVRDAAEEISFQTSAEIVSVIGRKIILYKESANNKKIIL